MPTVTTTPDNSVAQCLCDGCSTQQTTLINVLSPAWVSPPLHLCQTCVESEYFQCDDCDDWTHNTNQRQGPESALLCPGCMVSYFRCTGCRITMHNDNLRADGMCEDCYRNRYASHTVREYSYKPNPIFGGKGPHYMGVELECEVDGDVAKAAHSTVELLGKDFAYLKRDGSIDSGFEIVTHPSSLDFHRVAWEKFFDNLPEGLESDEHKNCGLHIHASRKGLTELTIGKMLAFVNSASNENFVTSVAGRTCEYYARLNPNKKVTDTRSDERYEAINLLPEHTVEFRLFKGTLDKSKLMLALEFVQCLIEFCKPSNHSINECIGTEAFFQYVEKLHSQKEISPDKIKKFGIDKKAITKRHGSASNPYPYLAQFCKRYRETAQRKKTARGR